MTKLWGPKPGNVCNSPILLLCLSRPLGCASTHRQRENPYCFPNCFINPCPSAVLSGKGQLHIEPLCLLHIQRGPGQV